MSKFFMKIYDCLSAHRKSTALFLFVFVALLVVLTGHVTYEEDIAKFLPKNERNEKYQDIYQAITTQNRIAVIFSAKDSSSTVSEDTMEMAMDFMGEELTRHQVKNLQVTVDEEKTIGMIDFIYQNIPYFLTDGDYRRMDSLLNQPDYVRQQMEENRQMLMMPMGGMMMQALKYDPLHLFTPVMKRLQGFGISDQYNLVDGYIFSRDGRHSIITFDSPYGSSETQQNTHLTEILHQAQEKAEAQFPGVRVSSIGAPLIAVTNATQIKHDAMIAVTIAVILILVLLILHYRRAADILWIGLSIAFGWIFALAGMAVFKDSISIIVLGIGSVIIGIAVNYPLHFLDHLREVPDQRAALKEMVPPLLIGNITTVAAFLCLVWLDAQAMRDLGLFGALMLIGTILFVLVFLPLYAKAPSRDSRSARKSSRREWHLPRLPYTFPLIVIITVILGYFSLQTSFDSDLSHINYMTKDQQRDMQFLTSSVRQDPVYAIAEGKTLDEALANNEKLNARLASIQSDPYTVKGPVEFLPSRQEQRRRIAIWNQFWTSDRKRSQLTAILDSQIVQLGFKREAFAPFGTLLSREWKAEPSLGLSSVVSQMGHLYILHQDSIYSIVNYVSVKDKETCVNQLNGVSDSFFAFSSRDISNQLVVMLNDSFNYIGFVCGFVVFLFLWISFGSIELSLMSFLPLAVSWIWILGIMQILGIQFNIVNIILATFIFGQGDDYTIFITEGLIYEYATGRKRIASYKNSVLFSALLMFIGIGCLTFARHPALRSLGAVTVIGMLTVVLMAWYLPPLVFRWLTMKDGKKRPVPITLKRLAYSIYSLLFFLMMMYLFMLPYTWLYFHIGKTTEKKRLRYHQLIQRVAHFIIRHVPGVHYTEENRTGEQFEKPAVMICNHQSHLDLMCLLQLTPKLVFVTNDWVWHNPFYGAVIHHAEYYPVSDGLENNLHRLRDLYQRGYSICIFPEGTRSEDCSILRFHKGAFYLARELGADILPVFIHGVGHVLPKKDFMLREGAIHVEIDARIQPETTMAEDANERDRLLTRRMHRYYKTHYAVLCEQLETEAYWAPYRKYARMYKGDFA